MSSFWNANIEEQCWCIIFSLHEQCWTCSHYTQDSFHEFHFVLIVWVYENLVKWDRYHLLPKINGQAWISDLIAFFFLPRQGLKSRFHIQMDILENYHLIACGQRALCVVQVRPRQKQPGYIYLLRLDGLSLVWPGLSLFLLNVGGTAFLVVSSTSFSLIAGPKPNINNKS